MSMRKSTTGAEGAVPRRAGGQPSRVERAHEMWVNGASWAAIAKALRYPSPEAARMAVTRHRQEVGEVLTRQTRAEVFEFLVALYRQKIAESRARELQPDCPPGYRKTEQLMRALSDLMGFHQPQFALRAVLDNEAVLELSAAETALADGNEVFAGGGVLDDSLAASQLARARERIAALESAVAVRQAAEQTARDEVERLAGLVVTLEGRLAQQRGGRGGTRAGVRRGVPA